MPENRSARVHAYALTSSVTWTAETVAKALGGKRSGKGWAAPCPAHDDQKHSLTISPGRKVPVVVRCHAGCAQHEVLAALDGFGIALAGSRAGAPRKPQDTPQAAKATTLHPFPANAPLPSGAGSTVHLYRNRGGDPILAHVRHETPTGKRFWPLWHDGTSWRKDWTDVRRPLLDLPSLASADLAHLPVLVVEGEKACQAVANLLPGWIVTTWPGGAGAIALADWTPLAGRHVTLWPDNDAPGYRAMDELTAILTPIAASVRMAAPPEDASEGWDAADAVAEGWDGAQVETLLASALAPPEVEEEPEEVPGPGAGIDLDKLKPIDRTRIYQTLWRHWRPQLGRQHRAAFDVLFDLADRALGFGAHTCTVNAADLSSHTGLADRTVRAALAHLEGLALIRQEGTRVYRSRTEGTWKRKAVWRLNVDNLFPATVSPATTADLEEPTRQPLPETSPSIRSEANPLKFKENTVDAGGEMAVENFPAAPKPTGPGRPVNMRRASSRLQPGANPNPLPPEAVQEEFVRALGADAGTWTEKERGQARTVAVTLANARMTRAEARVFLSAVLCGWERTYRPAYEWMWRKPPPERMEMRFLARWVHDLLDLWRAKRAHFAAPQIDVYAPLPAVSFPAWDEAAIVSGWA